MSRDVDLSKRPDLEVVFNKSPELLVLHIDRKHRFHKGWFYYSSYIWQENNFSPEHDVISTITCINVSGGVLRADISCP
jgi:hypothetical protein